MILNHKKVGSGTPQVALCLGLAETGFKPGDFLSSVFELSMYNHSNGTYFRRKGNFAELDFSSTAILLQLGVL